jgi:adenine C2-methylase RlmN of 23S rRNA A2503 and tRNA A37
MNKDFRRVWLPSAIDPNKALAKLKAYQDDSKKIIKIHYAFIKDQNDSLEDVKQVCEAIHNHDLKVEFNLVRYNPYSPEEGEESSECTINRNLEYLRENLDSKVKMINRVGFDVKASCGMFVEK